MMNDTQWQVFEVFHQQARGEPHIHVGSVHAPDAEMALVLAKEQYCRRQACVNLWVVPAGAIAATEYRDDDIFERATDKSYRESWGYKTPKTISHEATELRGSHGAALDASRKGPQSHEASWPASRTELDNS